MQGENDQPNHMTRWHAETPLVVWLLGAHEAQGAVVAIFGIEVKRHGWTGEVMGIIICGATPATPERTNVMTSWMMMECVL